MELETNFDELFQLPTTAEVSTSQAEVDPISIQLEQNTPDPESIDALAKSDGALLGVDPGQLSAEMAVSGGTHSLTAQKLTDSQARANKAFEDIVRKTIATGNVTTEQYKQLVSLRTKIKYDKERTATLGEQFLKLDAHFNAVKPKTPTAANIQAKRHAAAEGAVAQSLELRERVMLDVMKGTVGTRQGGTTEASLIGEAMLMVTPIIGFFDAISQPVALNRAYTEATGKVLTKAQSAKTGEVLQALRIESEEIAKLPQNKQEAAYRKLFTAVFSNMDKAGVSHNKFNQLMVADDLLEVKTFTIGGKSFTTDDIATAVTGLDAAFGLFGAAAGFKWTKAKVLKWASKGNKTTNQPAGSLTASIADLMPPRTGDEIALATRDMTPAQVAPSPFKMSDLSSNTGKDIDEFLVALDETKQKAGITMNGQLFTPIEQDTLIAGARDTLRNLGGTTRMEYSEVVARDNEGFRMSSLIGHSGQSGWETAMDALYFAADYLPLEDTKLVHKDLVTGVTTEVTAGVLKDPKEWLGKPGEWFLKTDHHYKYNPEDRALFGMEAPVQMTMGGGVARALFEPASRFSKQLMDFARGAVNKESAVKEAANSILQGNFLKLKGNSRAAVMQVLEEGDKLGKEFTYPELMAKFPDLKANEAKAYYEARAYNAFIYEQANRSLRGKLEREGWQTLYKLTDTGTESPLIGKVATDVNAMPEKVYDPLRRIFVDKAEAVELAAARGGNVVHLRSPGTANGHPALGGIGEYTHFISDSSHIIDDLPSRVLNFNPGQVTRIYDENWYLRVTKPRIVNGVEVPGEPSVVAVGRTAGELERAKEALQAKAAPGEVYEVKRDEKALRALAEGTYDFEVQGALLTSGRGSRLTRIDGSPARILDPFNAMNVARDVVANRAAWNDFMDSMKALGKKMWPDNFVADEKGGISLNGQRTEGGFEEAEHFFNWLKAMEAGSTDAIMFKQRLVQASRWIQSNGKIPTWIADPIARALNNVPQFDPIKNVRSLTFLHQVALGGPRTLLINGMQPLFLMGIAPISTLRGLAFDQWALHLAMLNRDNSNLDNILSGYLKGVGLGTGDIGMYKAAMEAYRLSGMPYSLDSHAFFRGTKFSPELKSTDGATAEFLKRAASTIPRLASATFRGGEQMNMATTFMVAARRYFKKNPKAVYNDSRVWADIASDARALTLDMSIANDLPYQKGWLSIPLQYWAIMHKGLTFGLTNKTLTKWERSRIWVGAMAVYGAAAIPNGPELMGDFLESNGIDLSKYPEQQGINIRNALMGGVQDWLWNAVFRDDDGGPGSAQIASSTSLANGVATMLGSTLGEDHQAIELFGGAPWGMYSVFSRTADEVKFILNRGDYTTSEAAMAALAVYPEVASGWSRYAKAQMGLAMSTTVGQSFKPGVRMSERDAWNKGYFGWQSYREAEAYSMQRTKKEIEEDFKGLVDVVGKQLVRILMKYPTDIDAAHTEMEELKKVYVVSDYTFQAYETAVKQILIPAQDAVLGGGIATDRYDKVRSEFITGMHKGTIDDSFVTRIMNSDDVLNMDEADRNVLREALKETEDKLNKPDLNSTDFGYEVE